MAPRPDESDSSERTMAGKRNGRARQITRAVAYTRVSDEEQARPDRFSLPAQRAGIEAHCAARGWEIAAWYADEGKSAKTDNINKRPAFRQMVADLQEGHVEAEVLVTHTLDRFARNALLALTVLRDMSDRGILYSSATESDFDYADPDKRLHLHILCMFAEYFSLKLSQHVAKGKRQRAISGLKNGRPPFGYMRGPERVIVPHPEQAPVVRSLFDRYATGRVSLTDLARSCRQQGYPRLTTSTLHKLLTNPVYIGDVVHRRRDDGAEALRVEGLHAPLVERAMFDRVRGLLRTRGHNAGEKLRVFSYPFAGLLFCAHCGRRLHAHTGERRYASYKCANDRTLGEPCTARRRGIGGVLVDEQMASVIAGLALPEDWADQIPDLDDPLPVDVEAQRRTIERELERKRQLLRHGHLTEAEYVEDRAELEARLAALAPLPVPDQHIAAERLRDLCVAWSHPGVSVEQRRDLAHALFRRIVVDLDAREVVEVHLHPELAALEQHVTPAWQYADFR